MKLFGKLFHDIHKNSRKLYKYFRFPTTETKLENEEEDPVIKNEENRKNNKIYHNVNYRLWKIKKFDNQNNLMKNKHKNVEINLLVRSKLAACEVKNLTTI